IISFMFFFIELPIAHFADRKKRARIAAGGAVVWGVCSLCSGLAPNVWLFAGARAGASSGRAVNQGTHPSLLTDYYPIDARPGVFAAHSSASFVGRFIGPLLAGFVGYLLGWRWAFIVAAIPTFILVGFAFRLKEPTRGFHERSLMGTNDERAMTEETPDS